MRNVTILILALGLSIVAHAQQMHNVSFNHQGKTIFGTFTTPNGAGPFPAIIITPGSGANDRNGTIQMAGGNAACLYPGLLNTTLTPYRNLSDALVAAGYAVLRYDKLEYTYTSQQIGQITFQKLWLPAESAVDYIKTRPDVDTNNIILIGHSEGSSLIPYIARNRNDIKALISIAGPRTPFDSLLARQLIYISQTCGGNVAQAQSDGNQIMQYFSTLRNNTWNSSTPALFGVPASAWARYTQVIDSVATNYALANKPTLFTGLQLDINVPPAELTRFQNELPTGADFYSISGLNHFMTPNNHPAVSKVLTDTIIYWLNRQLITGNSRPVSRPHAANVFPNPFSNQITVVLTGKPIHNLSLSIKNMLGEELYKTSYANPTPDLKITIDGSGLAAGAYLLQLNADDRLQTRKILKE